MGIIQWVNLEKDTDYESDPDIGSIDRCGALEIKTAFAKDNIPLTYKVKVSPSGSDNVSYTAAELGRNNNFKMTKGATDLGNQSEVVLSDTVKLPAAGGNKYKLEAKDANGKVVKSKEIEAKRKLYYQFMHMEDSTAKVTPYALTQMEGHCAKYDVVLSKAGSDKKIPFRKCINSGTGGRFTHVGFASDVNAKYDLKSAQKKVGCVTALSNYIASFKKQTEVIIHTIGGTPDPACVIQGNKITLWVIDKGYLWYELDDDDDADQMYFVSGGVQYTPNASSSSPSAMAGQSISITKSDVNIDSVKSRTHGGRQAIEVTIQSGSTLENMVKQTNGTIKFAIEFRKVKGFSGGFSWDGAGFALTTCCTKAWFEDKAPSASDVIWNHEIGHRMGMVAHGDKDHSRTNRRFRRRPELPDSPPKLYGENRGVNDKGHQGPHCESGSVSYNAATNVWTGTPGCVLFGATGIGRTSSPLDYCSDCEPIVRKLDLSF